jgi:Dictyostelium (slime mold) repeat
MLPARLLALLARVLVIAGVLTVGSAAHAKVCETDNECGGIGAVCEGPPCVNGQCTQRSCPGDACNPGRCDLAMGCVQDHPMCKSNGLVCDGEEFCQEFFGIAVCLTTGPVSCDDGDFCTIDSPCTEPFGCTHTPLNCDDGNQCTIDTCDSGSGCIHEVIPRCCRISADCVETDKCSVGPVCRGLFCSDGTPRNCDDDDACTFDFCDPRTGCAHTPIDGCGNPRLTCQTDADCTTPCATDRICSGGACTVGMPVVCDDGDPCTVDSCDPVKGCVAPPRTGFEGLACVCERADPPSCADDTIPKSVRNRRAGGCKAVGHATAAAGRKRSRLAGKAAKQFLQAAKQSAKVAGHGVSAGCSHALATLFTDDQHRAVTVHDQH